MLQPVPKMAHDPGLLVFTSLCQVSGVRRGDGAWTLRLGEKTWALALDSCAPRETKHHTRRTLQQSYGETRGEDWRPPVNPAVRMNRCGRDPPSQPNLQTAASRGAEPERPKRSRIPHPQKETVAYKPPFQAIKCGTSYSAAPSNEDTPTRALSDSGYWAGRLSCSPQAPGLCSPNCRTGR